MKNKGLAAIGSDFRNVERTKVQISLYLLCFLQFGEIKSANKLIFTVIFAIWRAKKCNKLIFTMLFCNLKRSKVQNSLYLLCLL